MKQDKIRKELGDSLVILSLYKYLDFCKSNKKFNFKEFEKFINIKVGDGENQLSKQESDYIKKHFKKEIFPLDMKIIVWMNNNLNKDINFYTRFKEIKKLIHETSRN